MAKRNHNPFGIEFYDYLNQINIGCKEQKKRTRDDIAGYLHTKPEYFKKLINRNKKTDKRDYIIMVCYYLNLGEIDTSEMLQLYDKSFHELNKDDPRDKWLISELERSKEKEKTIEEINESLHRNNLPLLDLGRINNKINKANKASTLRLQNVLAQSLADHSDDYYYKYQENCLATQYDLGNYRYYVYAYVDDTEQKKIYKLIRDSNNYCSIKDLSRRDILPKEYDPSNKDDKFSEYFEDMKNYICSETKRLADILFDTKNYKEWTGVNVVDGRFGANIVNGKLHVFYEKFDFDVPELQQYYLMEYLDGNYSFSVSKMSQFMKKYLNEVNYKKYYKHKEPDVLQRFCSESDIEIQINEKRLSDPLQLHCKHLKREYCNMKEQLQNTISQIKARKKHIKDASCLEEDVYETLCEYYGVSEQFELYQPDDLPWKSISKRKAVFELEDGDFKCVLSGDAETSEEYSVLRNNMDIRADLYVVGHHGSADSSSSEFVRAIGPKYAFLSVGKDNPYGHPNPVTLNTLMENNIQLFRTDQQGEVTVTSDGQSVSINKPPVDITISDPATAVIRQQTNEESAGENHRYVLNTNPTRKRIHRPDCRSVSDIKEENFQYSDKTLEELMAEGYTPCGNCHPD